MPKNTSDFEVALKSLYGHDQTPLFLRSSALACRADLTKGDSVANGSAV